MQTNNAVHLNVVCDGCEMANIRGSRFKCLVCDDYDLCEKCCFKGSLKEFFGNLKMMWYRGL